MLTSRRKSHTPAVIDRDSLERAFGGKFIDGNRIKLLKRGSDAFDSIKEAVGNAKETVCLQFYIYRNDETGTELAELLKVKAREGVRIRILYDHLGSFGTPRKFWADLRSCGIEVRASRPFEWTAPWKYSSRNHKKLIVIDGCVAFTGGLNIANEYLQTKLQIVEYWRDTGIIIDGPVCADLLKTFSDSWGRWRGPHIAEHAKPVRHEDGVPVMPIFAQAKNSRLKMRALFHFCMESAQKEISITTAYFTPSGRILRALESAAMSGVRVRLLMPAHCDVFMAHYAGRSFYGRLLRHGVEIYLYTERMIHAKTYLFDRSWSIVGSANLGYRSLLWNDEGSAGIFAPGFAEEMNAMFEDDISRSHKLTYDEWILRPMKEKIMERFCALFARRI